MLNSSSVLIVSIFPKGISRIVSFEKEPTNETDLPIGFGVVRHLGLGLLLLVLLASRPMGRFLRAGTRFLRGGISGAKAQRETQASTGR